MIDVVGKKHFKPKEQNHQKKRELLKTIISNLITIYKKTDEQLEAIPMRTLISMNLNCFDFLKWMRVDYREHDFKTEVFLFKQKNKVGE